MFMTNQLPNGRIHIIGIAGAGMSAIARVLIGQGYAISGSDAKESRRIMALEQLGAKVSLGHKSEHVDGAALVVASTAIPRSNPELLRAAELNIPIFSRAQALAALLNPYQVIAVAGTHGKTTTTSMATIALQASGLDPSFIIGSEMNETGSNGHHGKSNWFTVEADESDATFLALKPAIGVITNVEADHLDQWDSFASIKSAFVEFGMNCSEHIIVCADDLHAADVAKELKEQQKSVFTYGKSPEADLKLVNASLNDRGWSFDLEIHSKVIAHLDLQVPGWHNALNATAAFLVSYLVGADLGDTSSGLSSFSGTRRRFEFRGQGDSVRVYDDYAHHPTEVVATLTAAREVAGAGSVIVAFQPFRFYRIAHFLVEFGEALALADKVVVLETYAPGEKAIPGAGGAAVAAAINLPRDCVVFDPSLLNTPQIISRWAKAGDIVLTIGPGDMATLAPQIVNLLAQRNTK
jgi:UDP-N-acetylmuramate--alanine ligase